MKNESPEFIEFWNIWRPHRRHTDGRGKARKAFEQMIAAGHDPAEIIEGADWYLNNAAKGKCEATNASLREKGRKELDMAYIQLAASWLRSEAWEDWLDTKADHFVRVAEKEALKERVDNVRHFQPKGQTKFLKQFAAGE